MLDWGLKWLPMNKASKHFAMRTGGTKPSVKGDRPTPCLRGGKKLKRSKTWLFKHRERR